MTDEKSSPLVPTLRFPEFREAGEWMEEEFETFFDLNRKNVKAVKFDKQNIITVKLHCAGVVKNERNANLTGGTNYSVRQAGQFIFSKIDFLNGAFGIIPNELDGFLSSSDIPAFFFNNKIIPVFLQYWLSENYKKLKIERTGTSNTLKRISTDSFFSIALAIPSLPEQQKIAACLSSLDELITAHSKKLDALKKHKKGLMQQLFPAEGQTVPTLRFPEFRGEWIETTLGFISNNISSGKEKNNSSGEYDLYGSTGIIGKTSSNAYKGKFILVARVGANAGLLTKVDGQFGVTDNTLIINLKEQKSIDFIFYNLDHLNLNKLIFGSGQPLITGGQLKSLNILVPTLPEQQKIAACLSSLDEFITAHSKKLDALKKHKKGLMQQLFPAVGED